MLANKIVSASPNILTKEDLEALDQCHSVISNVVDFMAAIDARYGFLYFEGNRYILSNQVQNSRTYLKAIGENGRPDLFEIVYFSSSGEVEKCDPSLVELRKILAEGRPSDPWGGLNDGEDSGYLRHFVP